MKISISCALALLGLLLLPTVVYAAAPGADEIIRRSQTLDSGKDLFSRLTFTIETRDGEHKKFTLLMAYKNYAGEKGVQSKVIMFNQYPPDTRDVSFMAWLYTPALQKKDDMWLYLPQLRTVRKLSHHHDPHHHKKDNEDEFSLSELQRFELQPRDITLDRHKLAALETLDGRETYKVVSTPIDPASSRYASMVRWITSDDYLPVRIDYLDQSGRTVKRQTIAWTRIGDAWLWEEVSAVNLQTGNRTQLRQSDIKVNRGLPDNVFTKRFMKRGAGTLLAKIK
ncbi:MAG: outer membrane lipoprotein-sorting protein [Gammaproteobacteria bacterium]